MPRMQIKTIMKETKDSTQEDKQESHGAFYYILIFLERGRSS